MIRFLVRLPRDIAYLLFLVFPAFLCAAVPLRILATEQGSDLLDNIIDVRSTVHITLFAIPYLFAMFCASIQFALGSIRTVGISQSGAKLVDNWRPFVASAAGIAASGVALAPLLTHVDTHGLFPGMQRVGPSYGAIGLVLALVPVVGVYVQRRIADARPSFQWANQIIFRLLYVGLVASSVYRITDGFSGHFGVSDNDTRLATTVAYTVSALLVSLLFPSGVTRIRNRTTSSCEPGRFFSWIAQLGLAPWIALFAALVILISFAVFPSQIGVRAGTLVVFYVGLGAWSVVLSALWAGFLKTPSRTAWGTLALAAFAGSAYFVDRHSVADDVNANGRPMVSSAQAPSGITLEQDFDEWQKGAGGPDAPTILVLAEGGGIRAALWATEALSTLGRSRIGLLSHTYTITGVSGGALGAASFMAEYVATSRAMHKDASAFSPLPDGMALTHNMTRNSLSKDFLGPWVARSLSTEPMRKVLPFGAALSPSKGDALQQSWRDALRCKFDAYASFDPRTVKDVCAEMTGVVDAPMAQLPLAMDGHALPRLIFVATHVETGARVVMSSVPYRSSEFPGALVMEDLAPRSINLLAAAHASARFPFVSPSGALYAEDGAPMGRVVDGGYVDASGAVTALQLVYTLSTTRGTSFRPIVIDLDNNPVDDVIQPKELKEEHVGELETVGKAVLNANSGRTAFMRGVLRRKVCELNGGFITLKVTRDRDGVIGLGWTLPNSAPDTLRNAIVDEFRKKLGIDVYDSSPERSVGALQRAADASCVRQGGKHS
ncbi:hypothetical protein [Paraburkholderia caribensis]|uniref:hypothetical protein n=1 Tax=Paraburkholderia caribensis TaxID=75105 RepID=UPI00078EE295|nr:hypothetical protein [Paraburkholderia caribensis]AMV47805.1 hypothetical protein ATN79_44875 [Paraburkholderia caribensis]